MNNNNSQLPLHNTSLLMLCDHVSYPLGVRHGVTTYQLETLPVLVARGLQVHACFLRRPDPGAPRLEDYGITTTFLNLKRWDPRAFPAVKAVARQHKARLIHASGMKSSLIARWLGASTGAVPILHFHDEDSLPLPMYLAHRLFSRSAAYGMAVSMGAASKAVREYSIAPGCMEVIGNGIDTRRFRHAPGEVSALRQTLLDGRPNARLLGVSGRFFPIKGHADMIRMLAPIVGAHPDVLLLCIGDGPQRRVCEALARELGVFEHIRFLGNRDDVPALMHCLDLLLVPSKSEGLPFSVIEAQAAGVPVVSYDVGGMHEILGKGEGGLLVPAADPVAFVQAVLQLLGDEGLRKRLGESGQRNAGKFSVELHADKLMRLYHRGLTAGQVPEPVQQTSAFRQSETPP